MGERAKFVEGLAASHPVVAVKGEVAKLCLVEQSVSRNDKEFVKAALTMSVPDFAYLRSKGLPGARKWGTGVQLGLAAFGRGYCYLPLFRPEFWFRVARVLGPVPLLLDVLVLLRLAGRSQVRAAVRVSAEGILHLDLGPYVPAFEVVQELSGYLLLQSDIRIGAGVDKVHCNRCGYFVVPDGHDERCRIVLGRADPAAELLGDARHAVDVKEAIVAMSPSGTLYTEVAKDYTSGRAQRCYLVSVDELALPEGRSEHSWGSEFERRYFRDQTFRLCYLRWLHEDLRLRYGTSVSEPPAYQLDELDAGCRTRSTFVARGFRWLLGWFC